MQICPLCRAIEENQIAFEGKWSVVVCIGTDLIATTREHSDISRPEVITEGIELIRGSAVAGIFSDYSESVGHWGLRFIPNEVASLGKSKVVESP